MAKAGGAVDLQGCIGTDGKWIKDLLSEGGVGVERLQIVEEEVTGRAIIQSASDGENSIGALQRFLLTLKLILVLHKGANFFVPPTDAAPDVSPYTHLLLQNEIPLPSTLGFLTANPSITSIFNPSPILLPEELRLFPWSNLSWLIVNEGELETLLDHLSPSPPSLSGDLISDGKERITALNQAEHFSDSVAIICTLGATGILWFDPKKGRQIGHLPAAKVDKVRDTTGAGDCFAGYFAAGLMAAKEGDGIEEVLKGCLTVSVCVDELTLGLCYLRGEFWSYGELSDERRSCQSQVSDALLE